MTPQHPDKKDFVKEKLTELRGKDFNELKEISKQLGIKETKITEILNGLDDDSNITNNNNIINLDKLSKEYKENGCVFIKNLFTKEELNIINKSIEFVVEAYSSLGPEQKEYAGKLNNLWEWSDVIKKLTFSKRLSNVAKNILFTSTTTKDPKMRLYHDQLLIKRGKGKDKTTWHQDALYFPFENEKQMFEVATIWIPLIPVNKQNGTLIFAEKSHKDGFIEERNNIFNEDVDDEFFNDYLNNDNNSNDIHEHKEIKKEKKSKYNLVSYDFEVGDISIHSGLCIHGGYPNSSEFERKVVSVIVFGDDVKLGKVDNRFRAKDFEAFWYDGDNEEFTKNHPLL